MALGGMCHERKMDASDCRPDFDGCRLGRQRRTSAAVSGGFVDRCSHEIEAAFEPRF